MTDKDWLNRVTIAYKEYENQFGTQIQISAFINWLYEQYGIVVPKD
ncbi:hypothetical protein UFOVP181_232 [uncultured Caudovirales phage]|uniref:Uncharacterized protein n=1 Tax=uncultured Caudovirales phage TaxID=2100421 RepID=A0A6J5KYD6_9CAUD|nr:hypothetical protein UFOVP57_407 [uncultured Caudovirales phage]CAB5208885.1 hypothetical protein UFOVP181_232 [uncultured Caudovirales phage]